MLGLTVGGPSKCLLAQGDALARINETPGFINWLPFFLETVGVLTL